MNIKGRDMNFYPYTEKETKINFTIKGKNKRKRKLTSKRTKLRKEKGDRVQKAQKGKMQNNNDERKREKVKKERRG